MASLRSLLKLPKSHLRYAQPMLTSTRGFADSRIPPSTEDHRSIQKEKPLNPSIPNKESTITKDLPHIGANKAPPELISSVDTNAESSTDENVSAELKVGEMEGAKFKVEPLRRSGEDANTMRARLLCADFDPPLPAPLPCFDVLNFLEKNCNMTNLMVIDQSRKRGTLESDLLLSTFANANLAGMTTSQLKQYDLFLDENDWDIYYWATQEPSPTSQETAEGGSAELASPSARGQEKALETDAWRKGKPRSGEWAQTVGTFKPAYRPVPARWKNTEILAMLRRHVIDRSAGGVHEGGPRSIEHKESAQQYIGGGLGRMPEVQNFDV